MRFFDIFRPRWRHSNMYVRREAVHELTDQKLLSEIALNDESWYVRVAAVSRLNCKSDLSYVIKKDLNKEARDAARRRLSKLSEAA